jgi:hypothetical protein
MEMQPLARPLWVDVGAVDAAMEIGHSRVAFGSFDPEALDRTLKEYGQSSGTTSTQTTNTTAESSLPEPEAYKGFDLYGRDITGLDPVHAISEDVLIKAVPMSGDPTEYVKAVIDASAGESNHYGDSNEYFAAMMGIVDDPDALWCYPEAMDGSTSSHFRKDIITRRLKSWRFGTETTHLTFANTYPDAETAESGELTDYIESKSKYFGAYDGLNVQTEGQLAWVDGTIPTKEFDYLSAGSPSDDAHTSH